MIRKDEILKLKTNIDKLLILSINKQVIYDEIMKNNDSEIIVLKNDIATKIKELQENEDYKKLEDAMCNLIFSLPKYELYNLYTAFSIGRLGKDEIILKEEYLVQLDRAKYLCNDKYYLQEKLVNTEYFLLNKYLNSGLKCLYNLTCLPKNSKVEYRMIKKKEI